MSGTDTVCDVGTEIAYGPARATRCPIAHGTVWATRCPVLMRRVLPATGASYPPRARPLWYPITLRTRYAMSGTDLGSLRTRYAMSGTEGAYRPIRVLCSVRY
eukprot:125901-Rhodomonas_salina.4